jgi:hypothetical protein
MLLKTIYTPSLLFRRRPPQSNYHSYMRILINIYIDSMLNLKEIEVVFH